MFIYIMLREQEKRTYRKTTKLDSTAVSKPNTLWAHSGPVRTFWVGPAECVGLPGGN